MKYCMDSLVSIIVPVFNVELYLQRCLDSVINQSYHNLEIILVDDGSTDGCPQICDGYALKDIRVKALHKVNGGLSSARNAGLNVAKGEFIAFVDSDDVIHPNFVERLVDAIEQTGMNMSVCLFNHFSDEEPLFFDEKKTNPICLSVNDSISFYCELTPAKSTAFISSCTKLYKKNLFKNIRFPEGKIYEDGLISYKLIDVADGVAYIAEALYGYYMRSNSIMGVKEKHSYKSVLAPYKDAIAYFEKTDRNNISVKFYPPMLMREIYRYWVAKNVEQDELISNEILSLYKKDCRTFCKQPSSLQKKFTFALLAMCPWIYGLYRKIFPGLIGGR